MSDTARYVLDSSALIDLFRHYPKDIFKRLWDNFDEMTKNGHFISSSEVFKEIGNKTDDLSKWAGKNKPIFYKPSVHELTVVSNILAIPEFQRIIAPNPQTAEKAQADPFIIAQAKIRNCKLLTNEKFKTNKIRIPNVCEDSRFNVKYVNLHEFFRAERWIF